MSHPSRRAALHVIPTWLLVLTALLGLVGVLAFGGESAYADSGMEVSVDAGAALLATLTGSALFVAFTALVVVLVLELRRRRDHVES